MKTLTIKAYTITELPPHIQQKVLDKNREIDYLFHKENEDTLYTYASLFDVTITSYEYSGYGNDHIKYKHNDPEYVESINNMPFSRFYRYIHNTFFSSLYEPRKTYHTTVKGKRHKNCIGVGQKITTRTSHIYLQDKLLTGYFLDYSITDPLRNYLKNPYPTTLDDIINDCLNSWLFSVQKDIEYHYSDEAIIKILEANESLFTEDGQELII